MRCLIVTAFATPDGLGADLRIELEALGHEVRGFAYRRDNPLYKNKGIKELYQRWIVRSLEREIDAWRPQLVIVMKGGPIGPDLIRRAKRRHDTIVVNCFPDNPLLMIPFDCIEAYDVFFTKERYALRILEQAGLKNLYYLPPHCSPQFHYPVTLSPEEQARFGSPISFVGSHYPYRGRFFQELLGYPVKIWGSGWQKAHPEVRRMAQRQSVWGRAKLCVYSGSTLSLNHHHPLNDIVGINIRTFELAGCGACQLVDFKDELPSLFAPGEEVVVYTEPGDLRKKIDYYLAHPDEARAIGENGLRRALKEHTARHRLQEILHAVEARFGKRW